MSIVGEVFLVLARDAIVINAPSQTNAYLVKFAPAAAEPVLRLALRLLAANPDTNATLPKASVNLLPLLALIPHNAPSVIFAPVICAYLHRVNTSPAKPMAIALLDIVAWKPL